jgi:hypothetical protein
VIKDEIRTVISETLAEGSLSVESDNSGQFSRKNPTYPWVAVPLSPVAMSSRALTADSSALVSIPIPLRVGVFAGGSLIPVRDSLGGSQCRCRSLSAALVGR